MPASSSSSERAIAAKAAGAIDALAADAARSVADQTYRRHSQVAALPGARGRLHTEDDLRYHIGFLTGALAAGAPLFFTDYVCWQATVLSSRGVPVQILDDSLALLRTFFDESLEPPLSACAAGLLEQGRRVLAENRERTSPLYGAHRPADFPDVGALTRCLVDGDVRTARSLSQKSWEASGDYVAVATRLFQPALYDIGTLWQRNQITVAQEHLATAISQTLLTKLFLTAAMFAKSTTRMALFAGVESNHHVLGLQIVSDAFELAGWAVQYLGANTPTEALVSQVDSVKPDLVGLSASMVQQLPGLQRVVDVLRSELGSQCPAIMVGGLPTNQQDDVWRWIGADAWHPDAAKAVAEMA